MKFSVLIPSRNRLHYLKYAIQSVLQQKYENWEIIISDNHSEEDYESYINSLSDARVKYYRTPEFYPVTDNWNNALEKCSGDYVIMLGDDDCLLKDYFQSCCQFISKYEQPDFIYHSAYQFTYPKVIEGCNNAKLEAHPYASFLVKNREPFFLNHQSAIALVRKVMSFNVIVNFNAQHSLLSRSLINSLKKYGDFYQSPYPDYYATTASFIQAERILVVPQRMAVIGVTPKSFGYHYLNNQENIGVKFLNNLAEVHSNQTLRNIILPGTDMNTSWLFAMERVKNNFSDTFNLKVNYRKYRMLQVLHSCKQFACHEGLSFKKLLSIGKKLSKIESILFLMPLSVSLWIRFSKKASVRAWANKMAYVYSHPSLGASNNIEGNYDNILDALDKCSNLKEV